MLWLAVAYPLSIGPAAYAVRRGLIPKPAYYVAYSPIEAAVGHPVGLDLWRRSRINVWMLWWEAKAAPLLLPVYRDVRDHPTRSTRPLSPAL